MSTTIDGYEFKTDPFFHQSVCWKVSRDAEFYGLLAEMGCGKSKMLIDTVGWLYEQGKIDGLAILAPKGAYDDWMDNHFQAHMPERIPYRLAQWRVQPSNERLDSIRQIAKAVPGELHVLVMNIESTIGALPKKILDFFLTHHRAMLAVDESTTIGNMKAQRTKVMLSMRDKAAYRRILTGDAAPNSPLTLFSQCEFLNRHALGFTSFFAFQSYYCDLIQRKMGNRSFKEVVGFRNLSELQQKLSKFCFVVKKADCLDLPPKIYQQRYVEMSPEQTRAYREMKQTAVVNLEAYEKASRGWDLGERCDYAARQSLQCSACGAMVPAAAACPECGSAALAPPPDPRFLSTASLALTQLMRLHQIACGFVTTDAGVEVPFESIPRLDSLMETLDEVSGKVLIWANYRLNIKQIAEAIAKKFGPETVMTYFGDTSQEDRRAFKIRFQDPSNPLRFGVINQSTGKYGLTLTQARTAIYYSNSFDREARVQSEDRCHRIGQTAPVNYVDFIVRKTADEKIVKALAEKKSLSDLVGASNWRQLFE